MGIGPELSSLGHHLFEASVDQMLFHLEIRDAVAQQAADAIVLFENRDPVASARQLLCRRESRWSRPHHSHTLSRTHSRGLRTNPAFGETTLDDGLLDLLDGHRRLIDAEHARGFARRRTDAPGELRKII